MGSVASVASMAKSSIGVAGGQEGGECDHEDFLWEEERVSGVTLQCEGGGAAE